MAHPGDLLTWTVGRMCRRWSICVPPEYRTRMEFQGGRLLWDVWTIKSPVLQIFLWKEPGRGWCPLGPGFNNSLKAAIRWSSKWLWPRRFYNWINLATLFQQPAFSCRLSFHIGKCFRWCFIFLAKGFLNSIYTCWEKKNKGERRTL